MRRQAVDGACSAQKPTGRKALPRLPNTFKLWACVLGTSLSLPPVSKVLTTTTLKFLNAGPSQGQES